MLLSILHGTIVEGSCACKDAADDRPLRYPFIVNSCSVLSCVVIAACTVLFISVVFTPVTLRLSDRCSVAMSCFLYNRK